MTAKGKLTALQERVLGELAGMTPAWTLFGGGALIGFYLGHRTTRDLALAFRGRIGLDEIPREVEARLSRGGLIVKHIQTAVSFARFRVNDERDSVELDLVGFSPPTLAWLLHAFPLQRADEEHRDPVRLAEIRDRLLVALKA